MKTREIWETVHGHAADIEPSMDEAMCGWGDEMRQQTIVDVQRLSAERGHDDVETEDLESVAMAIVQREASYNG